MSGEDPPEPVVAVSAEMATQMTPSRAAFFGTLAKQIGSSVFFGVSSILIITVNKTVLTTYEFPSFQILGIGQIVTIITVLLVARALNIIDYPNPSIENLKRVFPLPIFYLFNLIFGLGSTKMLNLPMFTVLRRFTLLFIVVGQVVILDKYESMQVIFSITAMVGGALIAALNDLAFDITGYIYVLVNDVATAAQTLYTKKKMNSDMSKYEIMLYNAVVVVVPAIGIAVFTGDLGKAYRYTQWSNPWFLLNFFLSCIMGFVLIYSTILCTQLTSPLTLTVVGCIKNVVVTYAGMFIGGDYIFSTYNFIGINVSVIASLMYSYQKYAEAREHQKDKQNSQPLLVQETNSKE